MDLKNFLKNLRLNENNISMLLGAAVIVIVGFLVVNYFRNLENGTTIPGGSTTAQETPTTLPAKHTVEAGETLWSIAEKYYKSGYNWVDIAKANKLADASVITKGQTLTIPDVKAKTLTSGSAEPFATASPVALATATPKPTIEPTIAPIAKTGEIALTNYTVAKGDNLWKIAVSTYGDGFQWKKIAEANKLKNPSIIHPGNTLTIPR